MRFKNCYFLVISLMLGGSLMAQTAEKDDKAPLAKPQTQVTSPQKETKSQTTSTTGKTGTYQKATKQSGAKANGTKGRKPKTKKERLAMEAAAKANARQKTEGVMGSLKPGADGYIEVGHADVESFIARLGYGKIKIKSFTLGYSQEGKEKKIVNSSAVISSEVQETIKEFKAGQTFFIENAKGVTRDGNEITIPVQKFRMKDSPTQSKSHEAAK